MAEPSRDLEDLDRVLVEVGTHVAFRSRRLALARRIQIAGLDARDVADLAAYLRATGLRNVGANLAKLVEESEDLPALVADVRRFLETERARTPAKEFEPDHVRRAALQISPKNVRCVLCERDGRSPFHGTGDFDIWPDYADNAMANRAFCRGCGAELLGLDGGALRVRSDSAPFGGKEDPWRSL